MVADQLLEMPKDLSHGALRVPMEYSQAVDETTLTTSRTCRRPAQTGIRDCARPVPRRGNGPLELDGGPRWCPFLRVGASSRHRPTRFTIEVDKPGEFRTTIA